MRDAKGRKVGRPQRLGRSGLCSGKLLHEPSILEVYKQMTDKARLIRAQICLHGSLHWLYIPLGHTEGSLCCFCSLAPSNTLLCFWFVFSAAPDSYSVNLTSHLQLPRLNSVLPTSISKLFLSIVTKEPCQECCPGSVCTVFWSVWWLGLNQIQGLLEMWLLPPIGSMCLHVATTQKELWHEQADTHSEWQRGDSLDCIVKWSWLKWLMNMHIV